jgi:hypothetical protein
MKLNTLLTLIEAGYTKEEIANLEFDQTNEPEPEPAKNENEPTPQPEPNQAPNADMLSVLVSKFDDLTKAIQLNNIRNSENKQVEQIPPEELLASIVKPTRK